MKKPQDNGQKTLISDAILAKRLKNRERQRRYRERKRLKADTMKVVGTNQPMEVPVIVAPQDSTQPVNVAPLDSSVPVKVALVDSSVPVNVAPQAYVMPVDVASGECVMPVRCASGEPVTRVYSGRNWKRDARKAHEVRQDEVSINGMVSPNLASSGESKATLLPHVEQSDGALSNVISSPVTASENNGTPKSIPSRRNWKAEARNKKS